VCKLADGTGGLSEEGNMPTEINLEQSQSEREREEMKNGTERVFKQQSESSRTSNARSQRTGKFVA
jgi:hypothetical protein